MPKRPQGLATEWADIDSDGVTRLTTRALSMGWQSALTELRETHPFFVQRLESTWLANWHVLLAKPRAGRALDIGCGFGTLTLGLGAYYGHAIGLDILADRVEFASLRAQQKQAANVTYVQGSALDLTGVAGAYDLAVMNGVLEWAGLFGDGTPWELQEQVLENVRTKLSPAGTVVIAIENRFAMETLAGMKDTHTGLRGLPLLPSLLARMLHRVVRRRPLRSWLRSATGYRALAKSAGFRSVRVLETISSYNDYDYLVEVGDVSSQRLLWSGNCIRGFYPRAHRWRSRFAQFVPALLGRFGYSFLVVAGENVRLLLDDQHDLWREHGASAAMTGLHAFACRHQTNGCLFIVRHDGARVHEIVEIGATLPESAAAIRERLPAGLRELVPACQLINESSGDLELRTFSVLDA